MFWWLINGRTFEFFLLLHFCKYIFIYYILYIIILITTIVYIYIQNHPFHIFLKINFKKVTELLLKYSKSTKCAFPLTIDVFASPLICKPSSIQTTIN